MQVSKINEYLTGYQAWQLTDAGLEYRPVWETQQLWQTHFDLVAKDFRDVYDKALDSKTNRRHYSRQAYNPKAALLEMMDWETDFVRSSFEDLFKEERDLEGRVQRFAFYMKEIFTQFRDSNPKSRLPDHYHDDDYQMASLYLACQYPTKYAPYTTSLLHTTLKKLGAREIPPAADFPRYTKLLTTLRQFIVKDEKIMAQYAEFLRPQDYQEESALLVWHFLKFVEGGKE